MIIAVPVDEKNKLTTVCVSFGRAPYFIVHNTENGKTEYLRNTAADMQSGAGISAAQFVVDSGADVLLTVRCGQNAAEVLNAAGVKIYKASAGGANENIADFTEGKLALMAESHAGFRGHR